MIMIKDTDTRIKQRANFYWQEKLKCHLKFKPTGFINGLFTSDLIDDKFYWFEDVRFPGKPLRIFLSEIFDIKDYEEPIE